MHIPDGFLATPVWATLDAAAIPAAGWLARRAQQDFDASRTPLLGVMGAFVFAAQMINFPVGAGTSGHLVGGALLAFTLGPWAAAVTMTAILAIQALVFQDGGILALGPNVINMAVFGVLAAYAPYRFWGGGRWRRAAIFSGGMLSVLVSAVLAIAELLLSGIAMPAAVLGISLGLFLVSAALEGAITLVLAETLERMGRGFVRRPSGKPSLALGALAAAAVLLAAVGILLASAHPDGLERLAQQTGIIARAHDLVTTPLAGYELTAITGPWLRKAAAGLAGLALIYGICALLSRFLAGRRA